MKKEKFRMLLGSTGMLQLAVIGLCFTVGCTPEDPPMPPGVYVPKKAAADDTKAVVPVSSLDAKTPGTAEFDTKPMPIAEPVSPAPISPAPQRKTTTYKVEKGDSLWSISRKYNLTISELAAANNLSDNAKLRVGQKLTIPAVGQSTAKSYKASSARKVSKKTTKVASSAKKGVSQSKAAVVADGVYVVKPGDNFSKIAKRNGMKVADLIAANPGVDSSRLKVGQKLNVKAGAAAVATAKTTTKSGKSAAAKTASAPAVAAPVAEAAKTSDKSDDLSKMLEDIKDPDQAAAKTAETQPAANQAAADQVSAKPAPAEAVPAEKDKFEDLPDGTVALTLGADAELSKFCQQYKVKEADLKMLNPSLPADGKLKKGTIIKLP